MLIKQTGLSIDPDGKVITAERLFDVLISSLYASDFCGQTTVGDLQLMAAVYQDLQSTSKFDLRSLYGERGLVTRLITDHLKANPRRHSSRIISLEVVFGETPSRSKKLKAKAIKLVTLNNERGEVEEITNLSSTLSRYFVHYIFGVMQ